MRILEYLRKHIGVVVAVLCLLLVQAFCDLALPTFTADIVDVGIQQAGIEDAVPQTMRESTLDEVCGLLDDEDAQLVRSSYEDAGNGLVNLASMTGDARVRLAAVMETPMALISLDITDDAAIDAATSELQDAGEQVAEQRAIAAVQAEYAACGVSVDDVRMSYLLSMGVKMLLITALGGAVSVLISYLASRTSAGIARELREKVFRQVVSFSDADIQDFSAASLITRGTNDIQQIQMVCFMMLRMVLYAPILAIGGIIMIVQTNARMGWVIVAAVAALFAIIGTLFAVTMPKFRKMQALIDRVNLVAREKLTGLQVVRAFNRQQFEQARFDAASTDLMRTQLFTNRAMSFMQPLMMIVMNGMSVLIVWVGAGYIDQGVIQTGDMIAFITYAMVIVMGFMMVSMIFIMLPRADVAAGRIDEVLEKQPAIRDPKTPLDAQLPSADEAPGAAIEFDDVTFAYGDSPDPVLSHVSFAVPAGSVCAVIGSTGCGKSTLLKLLERSFDVTGGAIRIDGVDIREMSLKKLHETLGYVPQQSFLFSGTMRSNIGYGASDATDEELWRAAEIAQARDFLEGKAEGLDAPVAQAGGNVSGGQRQRLAIARAVACDARAFLFDDSFSALDYATDAALRRALRERLSGRTQLIVAQRVSTIRSADNIVVLDEGRVVGQGTHEQLLRGCATYREICASQLSEDEVLAGAAGEATFA